MKRGDTTESWKGRNVGVVGDIMLDHYIVGAVKQISAEASVPILSVLNESYVPGGAGNTARNIATLGARVFLCGEVGTDGAGSIVLRELKASGIKTQGILRTRAKKTIEKIRIVGEDGQLVRVDREAQTALFQEAQETIARYVREHIADWDVVVISDYAKGCITPALAKSILVCAASHRTPVVVDTKPRHFRLFKKATIITPNLKEAIETARMFGERSVSPKRLGQTLQKISGSAILLTQGEKGVTLFEHDEVTHYPTVATVAASVVGAGDTLVAALSLSMASGRTLKESARLANIAAGIAVEKEGTSVVTLPELLARCDVEKVAMSNVQISN